MIAAATNLIIEKPTQTQPINRYQYPVHQGEFWTAKQRQMHPVHYSVSYRASFKPELPDFFIRRYLQKPSVVLDPFGGRGTTVLQANLMGHTAIHNDISPVSVFISSARKKIPTVEQISRRLDRLDLHKFGRDWTTDEQDRFGPFFHKDTFRELTGLRSLWFENQDPELHYIMLTALTRLHGHSDGFLSVYSFPQFSILPEAQRRNNQKRGLLPEYRSVKDRILKKAKRDLSKKIPTEFFMAAGKNQYLKGDARTLTGVKSNSVDLIITSPPFLDKVDYAKDNWMRAWFIDAEQEVESLPMAIFSNHLEWLNFMKQSMIEMGRVLRTGGRAIIEVGEVDYGGNTLFLEELLSSLTPLSINKSSRLVVEELFLHTQEFTKLANCWDIKNNQKGTNTHRCLVLKKETKRLS